MLNVSNAFNEAFKSPTRQVLVRVTLKNIVYTNNDVFNVEYTGGSITGETFNIGSVFSNSIKITFTKVIEAVKQLDKIKLEFGIVLADGTKEFVSMGYFFVDKYNPDRNANRTVIEALDQMTQLERVYKSNLTYPARIKDVAVEIANLSGSVVDQASFERLSTSAINKIEGKTYRQAIGLIAQFAGGFSIFDRDGKLSIRTLSDPNFSISTAEYFSRGLVKNETMYTLGGIGCKVTAKSGDTTTDFMLQSGSPLGNQIALENSSMTQILLDGIYQKLKDTNYYPYALSWRGNPALEAGDWISMSDTKDNSFKMPNLNYKLSFSGGLKATSSADTSSVSQASASYRGPLKQQVLELQGWKNSAGGWTYTGITEPSTSKEGDVWFKPNGPDTETWIYEGDKWVFQTSTAGIRKVAEGMTQAQKDIKEAKKAADDAVDKANKNIADIALIDIELIETKELTSKAQNDATKAITDAKTAYDKAAENSGKIVIVTQDIDKVKGSITTKVEKTDFDKSVNRITQAESSITQNANAITQKVSSTDVENILTGKAYATKSEVVQTSNSLTSTIAGVRTDLDGISIGGQNLATKTSTPISVLGTGAANQITPNYVFTDKLSNLFAVNDLLTLSFNWSTTATSGKFIVRTLGQPYTFGDIVKATGTNWDKSSTIDILSTRQSGRVTIVFKVNSAVATSTVLAGDFRIDNLESGKNLTISNYKLERGNKATDWSASDSDKANQTQVTQLSQDLDGFKTTVSSTYLSKNDASNIYPTKTTVTSQINQSATDITSNVQSWTNGQLTGYSTIQQTNNSITNAVADKADRSQVTQLSDSITSTVTGLTNESLITTQMMKDTTLVNPSFNTMPMVEVPVVSGETYTVSTNQPWEGNAAHVFFIRVTDTQPISAINGVYDGKSITLPALSDKIYIVFRNQAFMNRFIDGQYWIRVSKTVIGQSQITSQISQSADSIISVVSDMSTSSKNLAKATDVPYVMVGKKSVNQGYMVYNLIDLYSNLVKINDYITVSFDWVTNAKTGTFTTEMGASPWTYGNVVRASGTNDSTSRTTTISSSNQSGKVIIVYKVTSSNAVSTAIQGKFRLDGYETDKTLTISNYQVQKGNIASDLTFSKANLIDNTDFKNDITGWTDSLAPLAKIININTSTGGYGMLPTNKPSKYVRFNYSELGDVDKFFIQTVNNPQQYAGSKLRFSVYCFGSGAPGDDAFRFYSRAQYNGNLVYFNNAVSNGYGKLGAGWTRLDFLIDLSQYPNPDLLTQLNVSLNLRSSKYSTGWLGFTGFMVTEDGNLYDWSYDYSSSSSYSQITQLSDMINLRVSKGDVTSQINIEAGRTLIDTKQLLLNANTVKFSGSAFIPDAMIQALTASKITVGTLNGANVNIINLNASNISAGTITGPNLSINLNSGEVLFQKGIIRRQDGNFSMDITNGILESYTSSGGYTLRNGEISFRDKSALNPSSNEKFGKIGYEWMPGGLNSGFQDAISVQGNKAWVIGTKNAESVMLGRTIGSFIGGSNDDATFSARGKIKISSGVVDGISTPYILIGDNSTNNGQVGSEIIISGTKVRIMGDNTNLGNKASVNYLSALNVTASSLSVTGPKNAIHVTRDGVRATPAYETAESYLGDIGQNYTREKCEVWIEIEQLFSDTVNTDITYQVFLQAYDDARFWVAEFKADKFLIKSDKPMSRFAWEIKAKRRGYESNRLVLQDDFDSEKIEEAWREE